MGLATSMASLSLGVFNHDSTIFKFVLTDGIGIDTNASINIFHWIIISILKLFVERPNYLI